VPFGQEAGVGTAVVAAGAVVVVSAPVVGGAVVETDATAVVGVVGTVAWTSTTVTVGESDVGAAPPWGAAAGPQATRTARMRPETTASPLRPPDRPLDPLDLSFIVATVPRSRT